MVASLRMVRRDESRKERVMARNRRLKKQDGDAYYHVMSRTSGSRFLFAKGRMKRRIAELLARSAEFSGVELKAYCIMDNHFHAVCKVAKPDGPVPEEEVVRRIGVLKGEAFAAELATRWAEQREGGLGGLADAAVNAWRGRMNDLSQFAKTFKELVNIAFKTMPEGDPGYSGGLWGGRFKSTLVEGGRHLAVCVRYVELNPVRAGIVARARDYAYSSGDSSEAPAGAAGSVPCGDAWLMKRVAQVGGGVIFGSFGFVQGAAAEFGACFRGRPTARAVCGDAYSTHGHRLAKRGAA